MNANTVAEFLGFDPNLPFRLQELLAEHCRVEVTKAALPDAGGCEYWHDQLMFPGSDTAAPLHARGLSDATIRQYVIGWNEMRGRYALPAWDTDGKIAGLRYWSPTEKPKYLGLLGHPVVLYPFPPRPQRKGLVVCEGEFDCLLLRQHGIEAVTTTGGKGAWDDAWLPHFENRTVAFVYDVGAEASAHRNARRLLGTATSVRVVPLGLPAEGADVTDWFVTHGRSADGLRALIDSVLPLGESGGGRRGVA